ncbi:MAG: hypothetical protein WC705_03085 [Candidatus Paceibacterota bacterium]|jgi:hypothetical protein
MHKTEKLGKISSISPKQMVSVFLNNSPVHAKTIIEKHYIGLWIKASGIIESVDLMLDYVTFNFHNKDGTYLSTNFFKPVDSETSQLKVKDQISLIGKVFNVGDGIVVLDNCVLTTKDEINDSINKESNSNWWEKTWVQIIMLLGAIAGIIGLYSLFR